jgi:hypothetical protein
MSLRYVYPYGKCNEGHEETTVLLFKSSVIMQLAKKFLVKWNTISLRN